MRVQDKKSCPELQGQLPAAFHQHDKKVAVGFCLLSLLASQKAISVGVLSGSLHEGIEAGLSQFVLLRTFLTCPPCCHGWLVFPSPLNL